jgi:hypothetical protein
MLLNGSGFNFEGLEVPRRGRDFLKRYDLEIFITPL